jgi:hydroxyacyl-ACP dehydratase HTD2-like protein with hotdog domain
MRNEEAQVCFRDVEIGDEIGALTKTPTTVNLFRYSAVTWNAHRIHYDKDYALTEGHPDILVQAHLHGAYLAQLVNDWVLPKGRILKFGWSNRGRAVPGDTLTCTGKVTGKRVEDDQNLIELELREVNQHGDVCALGSAVVSLPDR